MNCNMKPNSATIMQPKFFISHTDPLAKSPNFCYNKRIQIQYEILSPKPLPVGQNFISNNEIKCLAAPQPPELTKYQHFLLARNLMVTHSSEQIKSKIFLKKRSLPAFVPEQLPNSMPKTAKLTKSPSLVSYKMPYTKYSKTAHHLGYIQKSEINKAQFNLAKTSKNKTALEISDFRQCIAENIEKLNLNRTRISMLARIATDQNNTDFSNKAVTYNTNYNIDNSSKTPSKLFYATSTDSSIYPEFFSMPRPKLKLNPKQIKIPIPAAVYLNSNLNKNHTYQSKKLKTQVDMKRQAGRARLFTHACAKYEFSIKPVEKAKNMQFKKPLGKVSEVQLEQKKGRYQVKILDLDAGEIRKDLQRRKEEALQIFLRTKTTKYMDDLNAMGNEENDESAKVMENSRVNIG